MILLVTLLICAAIAAICIYTIMSMVKKSKSGCCGCSGCSSESACKSSTSYAHSYTVYIDGMSCGHCKARVEELFNSFKETSAEVDLDKKCAFVKSNFPADEEKIKAAVNDLGFEFKNIVQ